VHARSGQRTRHLGIGRPDALGRQCDDTPPQASIAGGRLTNEQIEGTGLGEADGRGVVQLIGHPVDLHHADGPITLVAEEQQGRVVTVEARAVFSLNGTERLGCSPPTGDVGSGQPVDQEWEVSSLERYQREVSLVGHGTT